MSERACTFSSIPSLCCSKPEELETLQPFLTKCISALEFDMFDEEDSGQEAHPGDPRNRKRTVFKRESLWQGLQTMYKTHPSVGLLP